MCGVVLDMIFFVVDLLYKDRKFNLFEKKINYVGKSLERYDRFCLEMNICYY